jgi:hypothetical protein
MQDKGVVFVTGDRLGDQLTALLEDAGCQVIRGPQPHPPALNCLLAPSNRSSMRTELTRCNVICGGTSRGYRCRSGST